MSHGSITRTIQCKYISLIVLSQKEFSIYCSIFDENRMLQTRKIFHHVRDDNCLVQLSLLFVCLSVGLSVCLSVCLCVAIFCISVFCDIFYVISKWITWRLFVICISYKCHDVKQISNLTSLYKIDDIEMNIENAFRSKDILCNCIQLYVL